MGGVGIHNERLDHNVWVLATALVAELVTFEECNDWKSRPCDLFGSFGEIGKGLLRATVEAIHKKNTHAGLDPSDKAEFTNVANRILERTCDLIGDPGMCLTMNSYDPGFMAFKFKELVVEPALVASPPGLRRPPLFRVISGDRVGSHPEMAG